MTARDIRYGRRGGAWADDRPARPAKAMTGLARCERCGASYLRQLPDDQPGEPTGTCPDRRCIAHDTWTPDQWEGRARMALARRPEDRDVLDIEAIDRARKATV